MITADFLGQNNFIWWFGVVENRIDPLQMGRCQVRCFGWHTEDKNQIKIEDLPWAHPIVPYGVKAVQPPPEGTMVFGFFADGREGLYPIIMGTVPGIPDELRTNNKGFADPYTDQEKATQQWPRKVASATTPIDNKGVKVTEDVGKRYPFVLGLNEPTVSRLARPNRVEGTEGGFAGIRSASVANTTIDIQRKNRVAGVKSASGYVWDEPFPSFAAKYPFNQVQESESGHAFEMDDTQGFERVQLSHRVGSTLEFLPEGEVKMKSMRSKYDITMGNHYGYVNGKKDETVQSDYFIRVNGKLVIQCASLEITSAGTLSLKGAEVNITSAGDLNLASKGKTNLSGVSTSISGEATLRAYGGLEATLSSAGITKTSGVINNHDGIVNGINGVIISTRATLHDIMSVFPDPGEGLGNKGPDRAKVVKTPLPKNLKRTGSYASRKPKSNRYAFLEQLKTDIKSLSADPNQTVSSGTSSLNIPAAGAAASINIDTKTGVTTVNTVTQSVTYDPANQNPITVTAVNTTSSSVAPPAGSSAQAAANSTPAVVDTTTNVTAAANTVAR